MNSSLFLSFVWFDHCSGDFGRVGHILRQVLPLLHARFGSLDFHFGAISKEDAGTIGFFLPVLNAIRQDLEEYVLLRFEWTDGRQRWDSLGASSIWSGVGGWRIHRSWRWCAHSNWFNLDACAVR